MNENEIESPLVVYDKRWHEALVYLSVEDAEAHLDPGRARNNEYQIYDGKARTLKINCITQNESSLFGLRRTEIERVILEKENEISRVDELRNILINYIVRHGTPIAALSLFSLDELIRSAAKLPKQWRARV